MSDGITKEKSKECKFRITVDAGGYSYSSVEVRLRWMLVRGSKIRTYVINFDGRIPEPLYREFKWRKTRTFRCVSDEIALAAATRNSWAALKGLGDIPRLRGVLMGIRGYKFCIDASIPRNQLPKIVMTIMTGAWSYTEQTSLWGHDPNFPQKLHYLPYYGNDVRSLATA